MQVMKSGVSKVIRQIELNVAGTYSCCHCGCEVILETADRHLVKTGQTFEDGPYLYLDCPSQDCKNLGEHSKIVILGARPLFFKQIEAHDRGEHIRT